MSKYEALGRDPDSERLHTPILPAWGGCPHPSFSPPPLPARTSAGVTLRKDRALGSLPRGSFQPSAGEARGRPCSQALRLWLSFPLLRSFSSFLSSGTRFLFLSPRSRPFLVPPSFSVFVSVFFTLFPGLLTSALGLSGSCVVSACLAPGLPGLWDGPCSTPWLPGPLRSHAPAIPWEARSHLQVPATPPLPSRFDPARVGSAGGLAPADCRGHL